MVTAPRGAGVEAVAAKVRKRAVWIRRQQAYFGAFLPKLPPRQYVSGETHRFLGRQYRLKVVRGPGDELVAGVGGAVVGIIVLLGACRSMGCGVDLCACG